MIVGAALGLAVGLIPTVRRYTMASIDFLRTIPAVALVPIAVLSFGPVRTAEVALATYAALWPIVLHTAGGVAAVHPRQYDVARMLRLGRVATMRKVVIPAAVPAWLVGARMAVIIALLVAIVAEMMMSSRGLGGGLAESMHALAPARMWAYAVVCGLLGLMLNAGLRRAVRLAFPGAPAQSSGDQPTPTPVITALRGLLPVAALLVMWQLTTSVDSLSFPPPHEWLTAIARMRDDGVLFPAIRYTLGTYALGLVCAVVVGGIVGTRDRLVAGDRSRSHSHNRFHRCGAWRGAGSRRGVAARFGSAQRRGDRRVDRVMANPAEHGDGHALHTCSPA